jgi:hypothetical protein
MRTMVVRVTDEELAKVHALAADLHEPVSVVIRRFVRDSYRARFGEAMPPTPTLKHGKPIKLAKK